MTSSSPSRPTLTSNNDTPTTTTARAWAKLEYAKQRLLKLLSARRPWRLLYLNTLSCPHDFPDVISRIKTNFSYFYINFAISTFSLLFFSFFIHPISFIDIFLLTRDGPIVLCGRRIDGGVTLAVLSGLTVFCYLLTGPNGNILIGVVSAAVYVAVFCVFRRSDDLFLNEQEAAANGLLLHPTGAQL